MKPYKKLGLGWYNNIQRLSPKTVKRKLRRRIHLNFTGHHSKSGPEMENHFKPATFNSITQCKLYTKGVTHSLIGANSACHSIFFSSKVLAGRNRNPVTNHCRLPTRNVQPQHFHSVSAVFKAELRQGRS